MYKESDNVRVEGVRSYLSFHACPGDILVTSLCVCMCMRRLWEIIPATECPFQYKYGVYIHLVEACTHP